MLVMALSPSVPYPRAAGQEWLLSCTERPADVQRDWDADDLAPIPGGVHWLVGEALLTTSMDAIKRIPSRRRGPVLADVSQGLAWWLLPCDVGDELDDLRLLLLHPRGWILRCPPVLYPVRGRVWVERPDGSGRLTDPVLLGAALGPGGGPRLAAEAFG